MAPLFFAIAGALVYAFTSGKPAELGLRLYFAGVLVLTYILASHVVRFG